MTTIHKKTWILNGKCRFVDWTHPNEGWDVFKDVLDLFISAAIDDILMEYPGEQVEWFEIVTGGLVAAEEGDYGLVEILPTQDGPFGDGDTRLTYRLFAKLLQDELNSDPSRDYEPDSDAISARFWGVVEECLTSERAYIALAKARTAHKLRLAAYAYDAEEGMHYLPSLVDPEFDRRYQQYLKSRG